MQNDSISLANILAGIVFVDPTWDRTVLGIASDSRKVEKDYIFLACPGLNVDGRSFVAEAIARGACAVIAEGDFQAGTQLHDNIPVFSVNQLSKHLSKIAARFYHHPSRAMHVVGVTGTNGKTSVTHFIAQCLSQAQQKCGVIGTLGYGIYDQLIPGTHTTPDAITLQGLLAEIAALGAKTVAMEVSSHSLAQSRVKQVQFEMGVFTNLTRDHLDFHESMQAYGEAKLKLFQHMGMRYAIVNEDDPFSKTILKSLSPSIRTLRYSLLSSAVRGSFLFLGPTVIGKTEVTLTFTGFLMSKEHLFRFDMSEYQTQESLGLLLGGKLGERGTLGMVYDRSKIGTLLFDEIEKAHPRVLDVFLKSWTQHE